LVTVKQNKIEFNSKMDTNEINTEINDKLRKTQTNSQTE